MSQKREMTVRNQRFSILKQPIASVSIKHLIDYPTPSNLSYGWGFGSLAGISFSHSIVTGIFLAMHYTPHVDLAFNSVEHIMRDVEGGWLLRYMHANGASMFFIVVYPHMEFVRCIGVVIFLLMILTRLHRLRLALGTDELRGATVITSLASAIPVVGDTIVTCLHYLLPFILVGASVLHPAALCTCFEMDKIAFYPYFYVKDLVGWDNYIPANPMSTPAHIVHEWYFLPHSFPFASLALPFMKSLYVRSSSFRPIYRGLFGCFWRIPPFVTIGQISPLLFFLFFAILPLLGLVGRGIPHSYTDEPVAEKDPISMRH
ncbi:hypothetical protein MKW92_048669 [Papaver armeniacum]|nr:hypothetical protein MKW92_048669 [Papaver armeniacum]